MSSLSPQRARTGHSRGVLPPRCPPSHPSVRRLAIAGVCCEPGVLPLAPVCAERPLPSGTTRQVPSLSPRRAQTGRTRGVQPTRCPPSRHGVPRPVRAGACWPRCPPSRPGVRGPATAGACCLLCALPLAPACADRPHPGNVAAQVSSLSPGLAQTGHNRGVLPTSCPPSRLGVRRTATTGACYLPRVLPLGRRAQTGHSRGVPPLTSGQENGFLGRQGTPRYCSTARTVKCSPARTVQRRTTHTL